MFMDYIVQNYKDGEPIFLTDISIEGMSEENIRYHLKRLTDIGKIYRFEAGVYYLPKTNILGEKTTISAETVAINKYIVRRGKQVGFYSGYTFANRIGLSTQVPMVEENVYTLQFLDCLKDIDKSAEVDMNECGRILTQFAQSHSITKAQVDMLIGHYPMKIYKAIYETGVKYVSA